MPFNLQIINDKFQIAKTLWLSELADEGLLVPGSDPAQVELTVSASDRGQPRRTGWNRLPVDHCANHRNRFSGVHPVRV